MTAITASAPAGARQARPRHRELRWEGQPVRVSSPVPADVWTSVVTADPGAMPFHTPGWRDAVAAGSGWRDASRLYEMADGRRLLLTLARRTLAPGVTVEASWPAGWGAGGVLAPGGVRPDEVAMIRADLASGRALSTSVRAGFGAAAAWRAAAGDARVVSRSVHVAHFTSGSFDEHWQANVSRKVRAAIRSSLRQQEEAGIRLETGNSPALVADFYDVYTRWAAWRARQRKVPGPLARWQAGRLEPARKFAAVADHLGAACRITVARWDGRPVAAFFELRAGDTAVGWRSYSDRTVPSRFRLFETLASTAMRDAFEAGCRHFELGESVGSPGLAVIKRHLGAVEHEFSEHCFERLPLTPGRQAAQRLRGRAESWVLARAANRRQPVPAPVPAAREPAAAGGPGHPVPAQPRLGSEPGPVGADLG